MRVGNSPAPDTRPDLSRKLGIPCSNGFSGTKIGVIVMKKLDETVLLRKVPE